MGDVRSVGGVSKGGPLSVWETWCNDVSGGPVACGHFIAEEAPEEALGLIQPFLREYVRVA